jgi:hypothetical protein
MKRRDLILGSAGLLIPVIGRPVPPCAPSPVSVAGGTSATTACAAAAQKSYSTNFAATENPISEGGVWTDGGAVGLDWTNVRTTPGLAFATQTIHSPPPYDDSIACLSGFSANQWCQGTLHNASAHSREVELLLRATITAHSAVLYEIDITQSNGLDIARWNGAQNNYTILAQGITGNVSTADGAVWYAQIVGNTITVKCNGVQVAQITDSNISSGNPGMGFYGDLNAGNPTSNDSFGWSSFSAGQL